MTQTRAEKLARLERRRMQAYDGPQKGQRRAGSLNDRKAMPRGGGLRSKQRVKADSRGSKACRNA